jgi:hypothetical protein
MPLVARFPLGYLPNQVRSFEDVDREHLKLQRSFQDCVVSSLSLAQWNAAPAKPYSGMTVYADGVNWNPGGGEGVYTYYAAAWNRLG